MQGRRKRKSKNFFVPPLTHSYILHWILKYKIFIFARSIAILASALLDLSNRRDIDAYERIAKETLSPTNSRRSPSPTVGKSPSSFMKPRISPSAGKAGKGLSPSRHVSFRSGDEMYGLLDDSQPSISPCAAAQVESSNRSSSDIQPGASILDGIYDLPAQNRAPIQVESDKDDECNVEYCDKDSLDGDIENRNYVTSSTQIQQQERVDAIPENLVEYNALLEIVNQKKRAHRRRFIEELSDKR